jgi:hypothetical protein
MLANFDGGVSGIELLPAFFTRCAAFNPFVLQLLKR